MKTLVDKFITVTINEYEEKKKQTLREITQLKEEYNKIKKQIKGTMQADNALIKQINKKRKFYYFLDNKLTEIRNTQV